MNNRGNMVKEIDTAQQESGRKELAAKGKEQGYLTFGEVNDHLPDEISDPEQIEDIVRMINDVGITVHETRRMRMTLTNEEYS